MRIRSDQIIYIFFFILTVFYSHLTIQLPWGTIARPGPGFYPVGVGIALLALSSILLFGTFSKYSFSKTSENFFPRGNDLFRVAGITLSLFLFAIFLKLLGFLICCTGLFAIVLRILGMPNWVKILITSFLVSATFYLVFNKFLDVNLPVGSILF